MEENRMRGSSIGAMAAILLIASVPATAVAQTTTPPARYGNPWAADGLANLEVGRYGRQVDYRFRAEASGTVTGLRLYVVIAPGYFGGDGGDIRVTLETDDRGFPSGTILATGGLANPLSAAVFRTIALAGATVSEGRIYHLRIVNVDASAATNWLSVDDLFTVARTTPVQPWIADSHLAVLYRDGASASWVHNTGHTPIFTLFYADGSAHGPGAPYVNARSETGPRNIAGDDRVGEIFTVSGADKVVTGAAFRVRKAGAPGDLTIRLATGSGATIDSVRVALSQVAAGTSWVGGSFSAPRALQAGQTYRLELSAAAGSPYQAWPLTEGDGWDSTRTFTDGVWQYSTNGGASWITPSPADDGQFYLTLAE
jgi:hypothetical protein